MSGVKVYTTNSAYANLPYGAFVVTATDYDQLAEELSDIKVSMIYRTSLIGRTTIERDQLAAENKRLEGELARLKAEVEKLNEAPKLYEAVERACGELPDGWKVEIHCEHGAGWVELFDDCGVHCDGFPTNNERLDFTVNDAIDAALSTTANGEVSDA